MRTAELVIIGGGSAGLSAAIEVGIEALKLLIQQDRESGR